MKKIGLSIVLLVLSFMLIPNVNAADMVQNPNVKIDKCIESDQVCSYGAYGEPRIKLAVGTNVIVNFGNNSDKNCVVLNDDNTTLILLLNTASGLKVEQAHIKDVLGYHTYNCSTCNNLNDKYKSYSATGITFSKGRLLMDSEFSTFQLAVQNAKEVNESYKYTSTNTYWVMDTTGIKMRPASGPSDAVTPIVIEVPKYVDKDTISGSSDEQEPGGSTGKEPDSSVNNPNGSASANPNNSGKGKTGDQIVNVDDTSKGVYLLYIVGSVVLICGIIFIVQAYKKVENEVNL